jgi:hypothetical protein
MHSLYDACGYRIGLLWTICVEVVGVVHSLISKVFEQWISTRLVHLLYQKCTQFFHTLNVFSVSVNFGLYPLYTGPIKTSTF